ncbi:MAG: hypothetical protein A2901_03355 [Elusimicrobia bacterium RIFCSPLOWO2_01_FULL_54_10]|nr:MAG: hypothetical protein A2901_03355 [Elusimicrobia bacterium RIFCSPLOWO2_01_FULL_54_10]
MNILSTAKDAFSWAIARLPKETELEVYASWGRGRSLEWSEGKPEDLSEAQGGGVGVRVISKSGGSSGQQGFAFTTGFEKAGVEKAAENAAASARVLPADVFRKLPRPSARRNSFPKEILDPDAFSETSAQVMERLKERETACLKRFKHLKSMLRGGFSEGLGRSAVVNSNGIEEEFAGSHSSLGASFLAEKNGERQEGGFGLSRVFARDISWDHVFDEAAARTLALLDGKPIPTGKTPVVFDPTVAGEFLSLISGMVCADSVQKGKSPFKGRLGETVASALVSIVDDGALEGGLASSPADDEGVPTRRTPVISAGKLNAFLYDTYTALKDKTSSTGNASRGGFKSSPSSGTSNFFLEAGKTPRADILKSTSGLYLYDVMGLHMADPISGDFSVAVMGARLEAGEFKEGVRGVTLAGNLLDLLKNIDAVGSDLTFFGSVGSPTFRVAGLTISGS